MFNYISAYISNYMFACILIMIKCNKMEKKPLALLVLFAFALFSKITMSTLDAFFHPWNFPSVYI